MDGSRYEGYVAAKDAVSAQVTDPFAAEVLCDLSEGLLLSRDEAEARQAQAQAIEALGLLVDRGDLARGIGITDAMIPTEMVHVFAIRDGKIVWNYICTDRDEAIKAAGSRA
jgi:hypothetical protein